MQTKKQTHPEKSTTSSKTDYLQLFRSVLCNTMGYLKHEACVYGIKHVSALYTCTNIHKKLKN